MKVFFAHPASCSLQETRSLALELKAALSDKNPTQVVRVRPGRDDYQHNFKGDWEQWQCDVVLRTNVTTGSPAYNVFVVIGDSCGRATASILNFALLQGRPVFWWDGKNPGKFKKVHTIEESDCEDWANGWTILRGPPPTKQLSLPF